MYCEAPLSWKYCEAPLSCKYCEAPLSWKSNIEKDDLCLFLLIHILSMRNFGMKVEVATFPQLLQYAQPILQSSKDSLDLKFKKTPVMVV